MARALEVSGLTVSYGPVRAVRGLRLHVEEGETVALLGPNGSGKSSTLRALMGLVPARGEATLRGTPLLGRPTEQIVRAGLVLTPEGRHVFPGLTVDENLRLGAGRAGLDRALLDELLDRMPVLRSRQRQRAGTLSGGEQQQLAIARSLLARPTVLMVDEPSLGLAPAVIEVVFDLLAGLQRQGMTMLIVEQEVGRVLRLAHRGYVLAAGEGVMTGTGAELLASSATADAYLGIGGV